MANNQKHVFDFEGILSMDINQKNWKDIKQKLDNAFGELRIGIESGLVEEEANKYVSIFNKILSKAKLPDIGIGDLRDSFDAVSERITHALGLINNIDVSALKGIEVSIEHISNQIDKIVDKVGKGVQKSTQGAIASVAQLDKVLGKIGDSAAEIDDALNFSNDGGAKKQTNVLRQLAEEWNNLEAARIKSAKEGTAEDVQSWFKRQQAMVKYVRAYEDYYDSLKNKKNANKEYSDLYNTLLPKSYDAKTNLQNLLDRRVGTYSVPHSEPWAREDTLREVRDILKGGIKVADSGGKEPTEQPKQPDTPAKTEPTKKDNGSKTPDKFTIYRAVYEPIDGEDLSRDKRKEQYGGAEIWTNKKEVAETYAEGQENPVILQGTVTPKNAYIIDAGGATWKDFNKMKVVKPDGEDETGNAKFKTTNLSDEFPELFRRINNNEFEYPEDAQVELYRAIKQLEYDSIVTRNVVDTNNVNAYKNPSTTIAVFDDKILNVKAAHAMEEQDEDGITTFEKKARPENIPSYYKMPGTTAEVEQTNQSLTEQLVILANIQKLVSYIDEKYLSTGQHLSDFLNNLQQEGSELDGELKNVLTTLRLIDEDGNLTFNVKRNGEDGGGTTHNGALISDDFVLIERGDYESVKNSNLPNATQAAVKDGMNVAEVFGYLPSKYNGGFFDVQATAKGHNLFEDGVLSQDVVNATDEQLEQLVQAFIKARDYGFDIENGGSNIAYDSKQGFSFYDLEELSEEDAEFWNGLSEGEKKLYALENLFSLFSGLNRDHTNFDGDTNVHGFAERIKQLVASKNIVTSDVIDQDGRNYEDIFDDVFSGDIDSEADDIIALLQAEAEAHKKNAAAINAETQEQEQLNQAKSQNSKTDALDVYNQSSEVSKKGLQEYVAILDRIRKLQGFTQGQDLGITSVYSASKEQLNQVMSAWREYRAVVQEIASIQIVNTEDDEQRLMELKAKAVGLYNTFMQGRVADGGSGGYERVYGVSLDDSIQMNRDMSDNNIISDFNRIIDEFKRSKVNSAIDAMGDDLWNQVITANTNDFNRLSDIVRQDALNAISAINAETQAQEKLNAVKTQEPPTVDDSLKLQDENDKLDEQNGKLKENINLKTQVDGQGVATSIGSSTSGDGTNAPSIHDGVTSAETTNLDAVRAKVVEVTDAINAKTQAFTNEETEVKRVVDAEVVHLELLENKISEIQNKFTNLLNDINTKQLNIDTDGSVDDGFKQEGQVAHDAVNEELSALQKLRAALQLTTKRVNEKTQAFYNEGQVVGQVVGKEINALMKLNTQAREVSETISKLLANVKTAVDVANTSKGININVKTPSVDSKKKQPDKPESKKPADDGVKRSKSDLSQLEKQYEKLGQFRARFESDGNKEQLARLKTLAEEVKHKRESLKLTEEEIATLRNKSKSAYDSEKRLIDATNEQKIIDEQRKAAEKATQQAMKEQQKAEEKAIKDQQKLEEKKWNDRVKAAQKTKGVNAANSAITAGQNTVINTIGNVGLTSDIDEKARELASAISELENIKKTVDDAIANNQDIDQTKLNQQIKLVRDLKKELDDINSIHDKYSGDNVEIINGDANQFNGLGLDAYEKQLTALAQAATNGRLREAQFNAETKELTATVKEGSNTLRTYSFAVDQVDGKLKRLNQGTKKTETLFDGIVRKTRELATHLVGTISVYDVFNQIKRGVQYVKEIDSALTELKKVTDETEESYDKFLDTASKTADKIGSTIKEVVSSTADFARLGYSMQEAATMAESAQVLMNVSEFTDVSRATDTLISSIQAFKYTAEESMDVVDILNTIGNNYAISTADLATSLTKSSGSLVAANGTLQEAVALTATANTIIQDADVVGTALKTVAMRLRGTDTKTMEEEGLDTDGAVTSTSKLRGKIKSLSGVDILTDTGAYKSTYQILSEIADVWENINDMDQAALLEILAGKRAGSVMSAILQNPETLKDAFESANNAAGSAYAENEKYMYSIQGRIDLFTNAWQSMWNNTLDDSWVKGIVDFGTELVKIIDKLGVIKTLFIAIGTFMIQKNFKGDLFGGLFGKPIASVKGQIKDLEETYARAQEKFKANPTTENRTEVDNAKKNLDAFNEANKPILERDSLTKKLDNLKSERAKLQDDLEVAQGEFNDITTNGIQQDLHDYIEVDTSHIDQQIDDVQNKLKLAKQQLTDAESADWDYYKSLGSQKPAKDRDNRIAEKRQEIEQLESDLSGLQAKKEEVINSEITTVVTDEAKANVDDLTNKIGDVDVAIQQTETELQNVEHQLEVTGVTGQSAGKKIGTGFKNAGKAIWKFGKELAASMAIAYATAAIFESISIIVGWVGDALESVKPDTLEDLQEELNESQNNLSDAESELRNLNSELDSTSDRIDELLSMEKLSFVEQEELNNLRKQSDELKNQIELAEVLKEKLQEVVNTNAVNVSNAYLNQTSFANDKTKTEKQEEAKETGSAIGKVVGTIAGGVIGTVIGGAIAVGSGGTAAVPGAAIGVSVGSAVAGWFGGEIASNNAGNAYDSEQTVAHAIDNMQATRAALEKAKNDAYAAYAKSPDDDALLDAFNNASAELGAYDQNMAGHMQQILQAYNGINVTGENVSEADKEQKRMLGDILSKYSIMMGTDGAKSGTIARLFGDEATDDIKAVGEELKQLAADGKEINWAEIFDDQHKLEAFKTRLYEMGLTLTEVEGYFVKTKQAEEEMEDSDMWDMITQVNALSGGIKGLTSAFNEFLNTGRMSAGTLNDLYDTLDIASNTDLAGPWKDYLDVMASGTATTEKAREATKEFMDAIITSNLSSAMTDIGAYTGLIDQLSALGMTNSKEYVDALMKNNVLTEIETYLTNLGGFYDGWEDEVNKILAKYPSLTIDNDTLDVLYDKVGAQFLYDGWVQQNEDYAEYTEYNKAQQEKIDYAKMIRQRYVNNVVSNSDLGVTQKSEWKHYGHTSKKITKYVYGGTTYDTEEEARAAANAAGIAEQDAIIKDIDFKVVPELVSEDIVNDAKEYVDETQGVFDSMMDDEGLEVEVNLPTPDEALDSIQSVFDALNGAIEEYNENGYVSVDTIQQLLDPNNLNPKYLSLLMDENQQLNLNKEALLEVARARLMDLGVQRATAIIQNMDNALTADAIEKAKELVIDTDAATESNWDFVESETARVAALMAEKGMTEDEITAFKNQILSIQGMVDSAYHNMESAMSSSSSKAEKSALELLQEKYERLISELDNKQTYLQNEVDRLEAENEHVSKSYYEEQINLEEQKIDLLQQEHAELLKLERTDEVVDVLWETEHAIQESTLRMVEFRQSIIDLYKTAFDDVKGAYSNKEDLLSDQQSYIDKYNELMELQGQPVIASSYQEQIAIEEQKMEDNIAELASLQNTLAEGITNGDLEVGSEEWIQMQSDIRDTEAAILDNQIAIEKYRESQKQLYVDAFSNTRDAFSFKDEFLTNQQDYIQGYADQLEALGIDVPQELYDELIAIEQEKRSSNVDNLFYARRSLAELEAQGYTAADEEWKDAYQQVVDLEKAVQDNDLAMIEYEKTIRDLDFDKFERFIGRLEDLESEVGHFKGLFDGEDVATEDGEWTEEGIASLGLLYHQMELNQQKSKEYADEIDELNEEYANGSMSEQEYYERLQKLKEGQWDAIEAYEDSKDAMVDMEEARIDMIEEGINEEIEAYQELIDLKKEELDAERDLYEFKKDVQDQSKDIASLERRIASLSGSTDASDIAERRKLEAELAEAKEGLDDTYYGHAKDQQSQALDDEMDAYQEVQDKYLEMLRETLDNTEEVLNKLFSDVELNADLINETINEKAKEHNITVSDLLTQPWAEAGNAAIAYKDGLIGEGGVLSEFKNAVDAVINGEGGIKSIVYNATSELASSLAFPWEDATSEDGPISTFSYRAQNAIQMALLHAVQKEVAIKNSIAQPWIDGTNAVNTYSETVEEELNKVIAKANEAAVAISQTADTTTPSYVGNGSKTSNGGDNGGGGSGNNNWGSTYNSDVKTLQEILVNVFGIKLPKYGIDGKYGGAGGETWEAVKKMQQNIGITASGKYDEATRKALLNRLNTLLGAAQRTDHPESAAIYKKYIPIVPNAMFAKGTLGTSRSQFAITDESWIGEEITLAAGKNGQLQYLKKGSAVMPADISANLVEWGKLNPNMMNIGGTPNLNMISNAVNKPEFNLSFEALVKADRIDEGTLPEIKKYVTQEINSLVKQMNYAIKGYSR